MPPHSVATRCPRPRRRRGHPPAGRAGFTLPELIVALALLTIGALAIVGTSASAIRTVAEAESQSAATSAARNRVEQLASTDCSTLRDTAGTTSTGRIHERWRVTTSRNGARLVTDSVEYLGRDGRRTLALQRLVVC